MVDDLLRLVLNHLRSEASSPVAIIGPVGSGKTRASQELVKRLEEEGYRPGGVLSPRVMDSGKTVGYDVVEIATADRRSFVRSNPPGKRVGRFFIKPGALEFANRAVSEAVGRFNPIFVDEVGRLELKYKGLAPSIKELISSESQPILLVRDKFVSEVRGAFDISELDKFKVE